MPAPPDIPDFTFGVEFEVIMPRGNRGDEGARALSEFMAAAADPVDCRVESYNHTARTWWKIVTDASIGYENREIVAPILRGSEGLEEVKRCCRLLEQFGCRVNRSTGMHVHVGMRDRFHDRIGVFKEVIRTYHRYEGVLDQLTAPSRRGSNGGGGYCGRVRWTPQMEQAANVDQLRHAYGDRSKVNFAGAYWRHGTIEFRHHQGTTNGEKAVNWIKLCLRMIAHGAKNTERSRPAGTPSPSWREPVLPPVERNLATGVPLRSAEIPRFIRANNYDLRDMVISRVTPIERTTRRNTESAGYANYTRHNLVDVNLAVYSRAGGARTHLAWDVDHGYVTVVRRSQCQPVTSTTQESATVMTAAPTTADVSRPATETTPVTLEGLFDLLEMTDGERGYFTERQMELNP